MFGYLTGDYLGRLEEFQKKELTKEVIKTFAGCSDADAARLAQEDDIHRLTEEVTELRLRNRN